MWTQQDSAEFASHWLLMMGRTAFDMRWERRYEQNDRIHVNDTSASNIPLHLQFDTHHANLTQCGLTALFNIWRQADGMVAALVDSPVCLCVHLDRSFYDLQGQLRQSECKIQIDDFCLVPTFMNDSMRTGLTEYQLVAMTAHLGEDGAGHYRSALRLAPSLPTEVAPAEWLLTEDWQRPQAVWHLPNWMRRSSMYWLIRSDCVHLLQYVCPSTEAWDQTQQILALLPLPKSESDATET
jgi:hypothetical protein